MEVKVRRAKIVDCGLVFNLTKRAFQDYNDPNLFPTTPGLLESKEEVISDIKNKEVLIAYVNDKPVGSVRFYSDNGKEFYLFRLGVLNKYQSQGVGKKLISEVEARVKDQGGERITLYSAYRLKELLAFYQSLGYEIIGTKDDSDYTRAIISKNLDNESNKDDREEDNYEVMGR
ncbi:GNAT family N-acetyltransferase [Selenihalanaerobacter shriftii]|uniref:Acetyltransferase (GNAT) family protein n=1 Tax=Selenihalanaerobacter shriftii TaxID=142842 RepID=A0A1T4JMH9_9FIRM|nr:GNAT family N-acetyltransferase [Selenihalanaerobacter shriftii]SJZ31363.1 Acetyltransferase (GNAT) family protein [Selenihalanaerobacter shriftii]